MTTFSRSESIIKSYYVAEGSPYDLVDWTKTDSMILNYKDKSVVFKQEGVEVPSTWSMNATNILAQKYFRGALNTPERETSLKQVVDRIVDRIVDWGTKDGYFDQETSVIFSNELKYILVNQIAAFNSPVWFNIGVKDVPQQASACFILSVEDTMDSILNWYREEGIIFKGGSGAGVNLSAIRSSKELLQGGGTASGPVSFMRGADASAGTIKSGGKTRRAAKMVMLDVSHPDIEEFIWCKSIEEQKARALKEAGFDMDFNGKDSFSVQYQNANNSVRVTDAFMQAVVDDEVWELRAVKDGSVVKTLQARELMDQIAQATWECADPGLQYDDTINKWHTAPNHGKINGSNPCSEYMHVDDSACNLASLNLLKFLAEDGSFDVEAFIHTTSIVLMAQDILVGNADYPTSSIKSNSLKFRQLGIGYANLGALLMCLGLPYDSDHARAYAGVITSLLTGTAYKTSIQMASLLGSFPGYRADSEAMLHVLDMHQAATEEIISSTSSLVLESNLDLFSTAKKTWDEVTQAVRLYGIRNAQVSVLAPTGTIGLLMDCDTTGVEPDLALVKMKNLSGGGSMSIVNQSVPQALRRLGYSEEAISEIGAYIAKHGSARGAPSLDPNHLSVFACSMGDNTIHYLGHVKMMAAIQPFISGAISKTVNMPEDVTVEDVRNLYIDAWKMGVKAVAVYRDNCKVGQPLVAKKSEGGEVEKEIEAPIQQASHTPSAARERLPRRRRSYTFSFRVSDCEGYVTVGEYDDGRPGEIFIKVSKQGSTLAGIMDAFAISVSMGLQYGVPLKAYIHKYTNMRFEPAGMTDDADLRIASSLVDYIFRRLAIDYLPVDERFDLNVLTAKERTEYLSASEMGSVTELARGEDPESSYIVASDETKVVKAQERRERGERDAPFCFSCGSQMQRSGSCFVCSSCGSTSGCS
jgi:ribonucleoside-diphosphate reductase alpha chain